MKLSPEETQGLKKKKKIRKEIFKFSSARRKTEWSKSCVSSFSIFGMRGKNLYSDINFFSLPLLSFHIALMTKRKKREKNFPHGAISFSFLRYCSGICEEGIHPHTLTHTHGATRDVESIFLNQALFITIRKTYTGKWMCIWKNSLLMKNFISFTVKGSEKFSFS